MSHTNGADADADTQPNKARIVGIERRLLNIEDSVTQLGELHNDVRAMMKAMGTLHTRVEVALDAMNSRGWTPGFIKISAASMVAAAGALVWMAMHMAGG